MAQEAFSNDTAVYDLFRDWARKAESNKFCSEKRARLRRDLEAAESDEARAERFEREAWQKLKLLREMQTGIPA